MIGKMTNKELKDLAFNNVDLFVKEIDFIVTNLLSEINRVNVLTDLLNMLDITTLRDDDYRNSLVKIITQSTYNVNGKDGVVAGVCIYSNLLPILNKLDLDERVSKVVVSGGFPTGQLSLRGKLSDVSFAIENGANEIDVPINRGLFFENTNECAIEISAIKSIVKQKSNAKLKVILETSELGTYKNIYTAAMIALQNGADFIKTSTGKVSRGADIYSSAVMMLAMKDYMAINSDRQVGFKVAGGIRKCDDALQYYALMQYFFTKQNIDKSIFRVGCSNLRDNIINNINNAVLK